MTLLKMDIDGMDVVAMRGAANLFRRAPFSRAATPSAPTPEGPSLDRPADTSRQCARPPRSIAVDYSCLQLTCPVSS